MNHNEPIACFITWTVYGTHVQGDLRGWKQRRRGNQLAKPRLAAWHRQRLNYPVLLLSRDQRMVVEQQCEKHCSHRSWKLWVANARTNHVYDVVTANGYAGNTVRDQLKANATRSLRELWPVFVDRPVWTVGGDWQWLNTEDDLESAIDYVRIAQDRRNRDT